MYRIIYIMALSFLISCKVTGNEKEVAKSIKPLKASDSIILLSKYKSGQIKYIVFAKDSGDCEELHISYYKNGIIKEKGCQGHFGSWGVPINTWSYYDSLGHLNYNEIYMHDEINGWMKTILYDKENNTIEEKKVGYDPHFGELDSIWYWKTIDKNGKMINMLQ